jgi:hypothetical protein
MSRELVGPKRNAKANMIPEENTTLAISGSLKTSCYFPPKSWSRGQLLGIRNHRSKCLSLPLSSPVSCRPFESSAGQYHFQGDPNLQKSDLHPKQVSSFARANGLRMIRTTANII